MAQPFSQGNRQIARAAGVVMAGMALSSITGLLTNMLVSRAFGTSADVDAFYAANRVTEIMFNLMAGGALASAFVPTFTAFLAREDRKGAWNLASSIVNWVLLLLTLSAVIVFLTAEWLVPNVFAPGFEDPAQIQLTVRLLRQMLPAPVIFGVSGLLMGILNAQQHFALPALAPASYRFGWILGVLFLVPRWGIEGLAWGVVLGAGLHFLIQMPALRKNGGPYSLSLGKHNPAVKQVGVLMAPRLLGVAVVQLNFLVNSILASGQPEGSLTAITWGFSLMIMPQTVIAQGIAIAALPTFSEQAAREEFSAMRSSFSSTIGWVLYLTLPACVGLILLREPLVAMLFERGAFTAHSTSQVAWALLWYAAGLVGHSILEIIVRAFYAMKDTYTPVFVGAGAMTLNVGLSFAFSALFNMVGWMPHGGLALANSTATALESVLLLFLLRKKLGGLNFQRLKKPLLGMLAATVAMGTFLWLLLDLGSGMPFWIISAGGVLGGAGLYYGSTRLLGLAEAVEVPNLFLQRILRRR
ncbi:MAG: murein biosynthesis integral membrane protein MurJ [Anaerolineales bacterium]|nr:murein biosynthesis integral membrane protein MurJ [Anaerolineales bacterium]